MHTKLATALVVIVAGVAFASMSSSAVFAQVPPNFHGQVTSNFAREGSNTDPEVTIGTHSSDPTGLGPSTPTGGNDHGRNGLANALTERGVPQHPSEVINTLCGTVDSGQFGCP